MLQVKNSKKVCLYQISAGHNEGEDGFRERAKRRRRCETRLARKRMKVEKSFENGIE